MSGSVSPLETRGVSIRPSMRSCLPTEPMWKPAWAAQRCSCGKSRLKKKSSMTTTAIWFGSSESSREMKIWKD